VVAAVDGAVLAVVAVLAVLAVLADGDPLVGGAAVVDVVDEPQAAIKSATPARTTPIRRTVVPPSDLAGPLPSQQRHPGDAGRGHTVEPAQGPVNLACDAGPPGGSSKSGVGSLAANLIRFRDFFRMMP
jgi:hypothetical protein